MFFPRSSPTKKKQILQVSHVVCSLRRSSSDHGIVYGAQSDTMAGEFFYVLALGGLLRQT